MDKNSKIYIAGHTGLVGNALKTTLLEQGYNNLVYFDINEYDLTNQAQTQALFNTHKPEYVFLCAAKVGGIIANATYPADFIYQNIMIAANVINSAYKSGVKKLLNLGSSCIYPKLCPQPMKEEYLLTGALESTNEPYAIAKISAIKLCQYYNTQYGTNFISAMPTNLYGPNDNFNLETSHVLPALIRKFNEGKVRGDKNVVVWGTGNPMREFLFTYDLSEALIFMMNNYNENGFLNVGVGKEISIKDLAYLIKEITGYNGDIVFDTSKPDGTPQKLLDVGKINSLGWKAETDFKDGLKKTYDWYVKYKN